MGFELDWLEGPTEPDPLCGEVLEEPLTAPCGRCECRCPAEYKRNTLLSLADSRYHRYTEPERGDMSEHSSVRSAHMLNWRDEGALGLMSGSNEKSAREKRLQLMRRCHIGTTTTARNRRESDEFSSDVKKLQGEDPRRLTVTLHRESGLLGFNIVGGSSSEASEIRGVVSEGIYVSKIVENGPAHRGGLKIHDRVIKVNGNELLFATHDKAVEAFLMARDPIEIEILRWVSPINIFSTPHFEARGVDTGTQTDITLQHVEAMLNLASAAKPSSATLTVVDKHLPTQSEEASYGSLNPCGFLEGMLKDPRTGDLKYEEVDLQRMTSQDELDLMLCYKPGDEEETGVYMSDVHPKSIAAKDGRRGHEEDGGSTDTATVLSHHHDKDSGVGHTDESTRNDESSEQENLRDDHTSNSDTLPRTSYSQDVLASESFLSADGGEILNIPEMECERFRELLELKCLMNETSPFMVLGESAGSFENRITLDCEDQEIQRLNEELRNIELECFSIIQSHRLQQEIQRQQISRDPRKQHCSEKGSTLKCQKWYNIANDILEQKYKDSSRAYVIGERSCSSSLTLELSSDYEISKGTQNGDSSAIKHRPKTISESFKCLLPPIEEVSPKRNCSTLTEPKASKHGKGKKQDNGLLEQITVASSPLSPYKHITPIPAHAHHYQSYMQLVQQKSSVEYGQSDVSLVGLRQKPQSSSVDSKSKMEWKVKIRSDGTRYITKRPAKEQLLKERALRIREERHGMTTDDDAASELKMGRYWSKHDRKQHAVRAKEQRQQKELLKQSRLTCRTEQNGWSDDIIQLSHKKMMRKRNKKVLDSWMTTQELLTHGAKSPDGNRLYNPLLSVTTV
ncbi:E3 ubiquitin-protein ligase PDZRN3-B isoform X2 [Hoplias malabaricus]|uniref:E3 ubiquitin-protein ligase PDZRN3-B isoform X2 n=1 Tax=Hoplias malabaricus TaxID=27720 RepID=UPI003461CBEE